MIFYCSEWGFQSFHSCRYYTLYSLLF